MKCRGARVLEEGVEVALLTAQSGARGEEPLNETAAPWAIAAEAALALRPGAGPGLRPGAGPGPGRGHYRLPGLGRLRPGAGPGPGRGRSSACRAWAAMAFAAGSAEAGSYGSCHNPRSATWSRTSSPSPAFRRYSPTLGERALFFLSTLLDGQPVDQAQLGKRRMERGVVRARVG